MEINRTIAGTALTFTALVALPLGAESASAAAPAPSTVTIAAEGTDLFGTVSSPKASCEDDRTVVLYKQKGQRGGGDDIRVASDTTEVANGVGQWSTGNTGLTGRFYAKVKKSDTCQADSSPTITATRN